MLPDIKTILYCTQMKPNALDVGSDPLTGR